MNDRTLLIGCVLGVAVAGGFVLTVSLGPPLFDRADGATATATATGTGTATATPVAPATDPTPGGDAGVDADADVEADADSRTPRPPPFAFEIVRIDACGSACRDVTIGLTNTRETRATNVTVTTRLFAGNETTERALIWDGRAAIGTLGPGETVTDTRRIRLGFGDVLAVQAAGGRVTTVTTVRSDDGTTTFERTERIE